MSMPNVCCMTDVTVALRSVGSHVMVEVWTTTLDSVPMSLGYIFQSTEVYNEVLYAFIILVCVYVLIIFDVRSEKSL